MAKQFIATTFMDGYADGPHITEAQTGIANQGLYGPDDYVLDEGKKAEAQILTNNSVRVFDATFVIQGRRDVMAANAYADVTIANGEQGMYRNDIIVRKYEKDEMTEIENTSFDVIKGTPSSGVATDPEIPTGDIRTGATMHNMALYRVKLEGLNIVALEPMFKVLYNMADIKKELESLNGKIHDTGWVDVKMGNGIVPDIQKPQVRRVGKLVYLRGTVKNNTSWSTHDSFLTIPENFAPSHTHRCIQTSYGSFRYRLEVSKAGNCTALAITNNTEGNTTIQAGKWFQVDTCWYVD